MYIILLHTSYTARHTLMHTHTHTHTHTPEGYPQPNWVSHVTSLSVNFHLFRHSSLNTCSEGPNTATGKPAHHMVHIQSCGLRALDSCGYLVACYDYTHTHMTMSDVAQM